LGRREGRQTLNRTATASCSSARFRPSSPIAPSLYSSTPHECVIVPLVASRPPPRLRPHPLRPTRDPRTRGGGGGPGWRGDRGGGGAGGSFVKQWGGMRPACGTAHAHAAQPRGAQAGKAQVGNGFRAWAFGSHLPPARKGAWAARWWATESGSIGSAMRSAGPPREHRGLSLYRQRKKKARFVRLRASGMAGIEPTPPARKSRGLPA
jgi:hypothetical protein